MSIKRISLGMAAAATAAGLISAAPAHAAGTYIRGCLSYGCTAPMFAGPSADRHYSDTWNNTPVSMICWTDSQWYTVNYSTNRWFKVNSAMYGIFWVHASETYNQTVTPHC